jgi:hypothetical protein
MALLGSEMLSKLGKPLKEMVYEYIPGKDKVDEMLMKNKHESEESDLKKKKALKSYELMSSLVDENEDDFEDEDGDGASSEESAKAIKSVFSAQHRRYTRLTQPQHFGRQWRKESHGGFKVWQWVCPAS